MGLKHVRQDEFLMIRLGYLTVGSSLFKHLPKIFFKFAAVQVQMFDSVAVLFV